VAASTRAWAVLVLLVLLNGAGCGGDEEALTEREVNATKLIEAQVSEELRCHDNGAVNTELLPEHPVGFSCYNEAGEFYAAVISADGVVTSLSGPVRLNPAAP
jgi:hypothetical protein